MIKYITYQGQKHPVRVSFMALMKVQEETGSDILTGENFNLKSLEPLLYWSLQAGYHYERKIFDIKREEIIYMLDENFKEFVKIVSDFNSAPDLDEAPKNAAKKKTK